MKRYRTIYADPPWMERGGGQTCRGANRHYPLLRTEEICAIPVARIVADDAHLYLWVTNNFLPAGLQVMTEWGFRYVTAITWVKGTFGLGQYFRGTTEHCLFGVRGRLPYRRENGKRQQGVTAILEHPRGHSVKPEAMRTMIERVSYPPRIELFARQRVAGWDAWGNDVASSIELRITQASSLEDYNSARILPSLLSRPSSMAWSKISLGQSSEMPCISTR